ncbi:AraD1 family protein [Dyella sp. A6]|uniref:AraD1 family protein n=1 Tax=Dyella aluminiiresistens TaxID=3069105 RepID=UPI002E766970|nr:AraD1 family protein [Dyella sp. A6]
MRLIQFLDDTHAPRVGQVSPDGTTVREVTGHASVYDLASYALAHQRSLDDLVAAHLGGRSYDYAKLLDELRVLAPLRHPDPAHCLVTGTGLTHTGSASARDAMHQKQAAAGDDDASLTDSMRIFRWGMEGGRPTDGRPGAQPEWFYKGNGDMVVAPGAPLHSPAFALDGGEEPELVGLYLIDGEGCPRRIGFALGNEFSDHVTERQNYLYLAHSKLRQCAIGPEIWTGPLPADLRGTSRIRRNGNVIWEKPFLTGEANMCHSLANLEYHHFKYAAHRRPGDVHMHFMGTATLSVADGIRTEPGDEFEIDLPALGAALRNPLKVADAEFAMGDVRPL